MQKNKPDIIILGHIGAGSTCAHLAADYIMEKGMRVVVVQKEEVNKLSEPFIITRNRDFVQPFIEPKVDVFNYRKHRQTCDANRKRRKNKKRK